MRCGCFAAPGGRKGLDMKHRLLILTACFIILFCCMSAFAHEYDRNDSDHPGRVLSYVVHPFGVALEWTVTRPVHWFVHLPGMGYVFGHEAYPTATVVAPIGPMPEEPKTVFRSAAGEEDMTPPRLRGGLEQAVEVVVVPDGVEYSMVGAVLFHPGSADLTEDGRALLSQLGTQLQEDYPQADLVIEGHTDDQPIEHSQWKSNWELGSARALALLHFLVEQGFSPERLSAVSYGEFKQRVPNDSEENRMRNRRAVITVKQPATPEAVVVEPLPEAME